MQEWFYTNFVQLGDLAQLNPFLYSNEYSTLYEVGKNWLE